MTRAAWALSILLLAACRQAPAPAPAVPAAAVPAAAVAAAPAVAATVGAPAAAASIASASAYDETVVNFGGYGTARFNDDAAAVKQAWGKPMVLTAAPETPEACHYLMTQPRNPAGFGLAFMIEGGKFVRYDVDAPGIVAPGGLAVGSRVADVHAAFGDRVSVQPHKYVEGGQVLVVTPADGGEARLVFEADANGIITAWRIGLEPQVHYVEGCS